MSVAALRLVVLMSVVALVSAGSGNCGNVKWDMSKPTPMHQTCVDCTRESSYMTRCGWCMGSNGESNGCIASSMISKVCKGGTFVTDRKECKAKVGISGISNKQIGDAANAIKHKGGAAIRGGMKYMENWYNTGGDEMIQKAINFLAGQLRVSADVLKSKITETMNDPETKKWICKKAKEGESASDKDKAEKVCNALRSDEQSSLKVALAAFAPTITTVLKQPGVCEKLFEASGTNLGKYVKDNCNKGLFSRW